MQLDTQMGSMELARVSDECRRYEQQGFDAVWTYETTHDPYFPIVLGAAATQRIHFGTNIAIAFARSPYSTALSAWDLQKLSKGRFHLGLGTQVRAHVERRFSMPFEHPAARVKDLVNCVRAVWDTFQNDAKPAYEGQFYRFQLMNPMFNPGPIDHPDIPIYLAGVNPTMLKAAGEVADGFHVHPFHSREYLEKVVRENLDIGAKLRGKRVTDMHLACPVFVVTGDTQAETDKSLEETRRQISFYASTPSYRAVLNYHGMEELGKELSQHARTGQWDAMVKLITDDMVQLFATVASPAKLPQALHARYDGLLDRISLYLPIAGETQSSDWSGFMKAFRKA